MPSNLVKFNTETFRCKYEYLPNATEEDGALAVVTDRANSVYMASNGLWKSLIFNAVATALLSPTTGAEVPLVKTNQKALIAGDSNTAQNRSDTSTFLKYSDRGYFVWANSYLGQRLELVKNAGINGDTTAMLLARLSADVLAYNAGWNFILCGVNDILTGVPWATTVSNLQLIYEAIIANGGNVVAMAVMPCGSFSTDTHKEALVNINLWIKNYSVRNPKVWFVDSYMPLLNPASTTGAPLTTYMWDSTTHLSTLGAQIIGKAIFNVLDSVIPKVGIQSSLADSVSPTNPYGNFVANPVMSGTGGTNETGSSGSIADNWRSIRTAGTATAVGAKVARTDYPNLEWQQITITSTSGSSTYWLYAFGETLAGSGISAGDLVYAQFEIDLSFTGVTLSDLKPYLLSTTGTGILTAYANGQNDGSIRNDGPYVFRTPNFTIPLDATGSPRPVIELVFSGSGSLVLKAGRVEIRKVQQS
ncbi:MAG: SGNH/GDSL hydrolase family protein [Methylophilus sp.]|jgi:lysophospholipase L1-like esterase